MVSLLTDLVKTYVEKLIDGAISETRNVCCFTSIAKEFEEEKVRLEAERRTMGQRANVASGSGNDIAANARHWEEEVDKLIQEDIETKKKRFFGFCPDCIWRYKGGKKLANKIKDMKRLVEKGEKLENIELPHRLPDIEFYSSQNYICFKSRESKYKELLEALKDESNFITGLHSMGGAGKTTLAKEVGKELKQSNEFTHVVITTVSYTPDIKKIQDDIAGSLGLDLGSCNDSDRHKKLWSRITNGEKILVILDDVWDENPPLDFDAIGIPKQDNHKGCKVLVTTRNKRVLNKMDCDDIVKLDVLSEEDSHIMFERYAGISNNSPKRLIDKGRKIADECKRLPVAIAVVASSLKGQQSLEEWDVALKSLQNPLSSIQGVTDESLVKIYNCLKFSYDYLKDEKVRGLFLLCSTFPEDDAIPDEILTRLGVGTSLFGEVYGSYNDARNQVVVAKNKLLDSCLLLETDEGCVKMHDLVRDAAQLIANQEIRTVNMSHKDPKSLVDREKDTKYLFWEGNVREMFSSSFGGPKLEILIAIINMDGYNDRVEGVEVPNSFFENMAGLRALQLECSKCSRCALSLPRSIWSLMTIRSLLVENIDLGDITVLGNLQYLETFDLVQCIIDELPNEITKLEKFKLLKLVDCRIRMNNPFNVIGKCSFLEELYFEDSFNDFCRDINVPTLQRYVISTLLWKDIELVGSVSKCVSLYGHRHRDILSEATLKYIAQTAEVLRLDGIKWRWRNIIPEIVPIDQGMNDIVLLKLGGISELRYLTNTIASQVPNVFSKLVALTLRQLENLEELFNGPLSLDSLQVLEKLSIGRCKNLQRLSKFNLNLCNLTTMKLKKCPSLVSLFQLSTAKSLMMLEEMEIYDCEQLESIITDETRGEESKEEILVDGDNDNNKLSSMFPKLTALNIYGCPRLEFILPFVSGDLPVLETIIIESCEKLKYIFDKFVKVGSLKELKLCGSPNFIAIFPESGGHLVPLFGSGSSSSTLRDGFKAPTQLDPIKCNVFSWTHKCCYGLKYRQKLRSTTTSKIQLVSENQPQHCPIASELRGNVEHFLTLEELQVINSKVENIFFLNEINGQQLNFMLQNIELQDLHVMTYVFVGPKSSVILQNLKTIKIGQCEKLEIIFPTSVVRCLPQLIDLRIEECKQLKHVIEDDAEDDVDSEITCFPKLEKLIVVNCNKLKCVFPVSICKELHELRLLMIREANELQEIFRSKDAQKVEIPNLKLIAFVNLPSLYETQAIQFQNVENRLVENCQKLSLTSVSTLSFKEIADLDRGLRIYIENRVDQLRDDSEAQDMRNETTKDFATGTEVQAKSRHEFSLQELQEFLMAPFGDNSFKTGEEILSAYLESIRSSSRPLVPFEHKTFSHQDSDGKISTPSPLASESLSTPYEGNASQIVGILSSSSLITWELQQEAQVSQHGEDLKLQMITSEADLESIIQLEAQVQ